MDKSVKIYALRCPVKRLKSHLRDARRRKTPVYNWINKLTSNGIIPNIELLHTCVDGEDWREIEKRFISEYRTNGNNLLNVADGGDEPFCSYEVRAKNARNNTKKLHSDPKRKELWRLKNMMVQTLNFLKCGNYTDIYNSAVTRLHQRAHERPELFGWTLQYQTI